jgi:hypothetical protein
VILGAPEILHAASWGEEELVSGRRAEGKRERERIRPRQGSHGEEGRQVPLPSCWKPVAPPAPQVAVAPPTGFLVSGHLPPDLCVHYLFTQQTSPVLGS